MITKRTQFAFLGLLIVMAYQQTILIVINYAKDKPALLHDFFANRWVGIFDINILSVIMAVVAVCVICYEAIKD